MRQLGIKEMILSASSKGMLIMLAPLLKLSKVEITRAVEVSSLDSRTIIVP
jgi:hypothetical protein